MKQLIIEGDLELTASFEQLLREELTDETLEEQVSIETRIIPVEVAPGELGFGEEIRQVLLGVSELLKSVPDATKSIADGLKARLSQSSAKIELLPDDGGVKIYLRGKDVPEIAKEVARVLRTHQGN